ncbi:MAG TPA: ATP synthase subunit I [Candidatus Binataceae bacterium]|nr:ATP synthase subunit I [Candidatus Binataceae bacterium]
MTAGALVIILAYAALGALLAAGYFQALGWNVHLYAKDGAAWPALIVHVGRLVVIAGALTICARQGGLPLISTLAGFQIMRTAAIRRQLQAFGATP